MTEQKLEPALVNRILNRLGIDFPAQTDGESLQKVYAAWCQKVPFDNVRKIIQVRSQSPAPLPGTEVVDFFEAWLSHGTGGTCWSGAGALQTFLTTLGFDVQRGIATMLAAPVLPPNHGTLKVRLDGQDYLLDSSILHAEPLRLDTELETSIQHPAWGLTCSQREGRWYIQWRPLHNTDGFECRLESFGPGSHDFSSRYEATRDWSPFNYQLNARINRGDQVVGLAFGNAVTLLADGQVIITPVDDQERRRILREDFGMSEEIVQQLPGDIPTPPPPGSQTAATAHQND